MEKMKIMSMIQPTGRIHLGNYLGAIKQWQEFQANANNDCRFGIADLHSLTKEMRAEERKTNVNNMIMDLIALGIDPANLYVQSDIEGTTELAWLLSMHVSHNEMTRMTQFKDKGGGSMGLFTYPILQAADILIHNADVVPVGEDQKQHLELAKKLAKRFNDAYGETFTVPKPLIVKGTKVMSVKDPTKKMSKSLGDAHCIYLNDSAEDIERKINKMPTDNGELKGTKEMTPGVENIFNLLEVFADDVVYEDMFSQYCSGELQYGALKQALKDCLIPFCLQFQEKRAKVVENNRHCSAYGLIQKNHFYSWELRNYLPQIRVGLDYL
jgi:tryptophanyl-tRNA synthetase